jgi:hypothetical protein
MGSAHKHALSKSGGDAGFLRPSTSHSRPSTSHSQTGAPNLTLSLTSSASLSALTTLRPASSHNVRPTLRPATVDNSYSGIPSSSALSGPLSAAQAYMRKLSFGDASSESSRLGTGRVRSKLPGRSRPGTAASRVQYVFKRDR